MAGPTKKLRLTQRGLLMDFLSTLRPRRPSLPWAMAAGMSLLTACRAALAAETMFPGREWVVRRPEQVDLDPSKLDAFATRVGGDGVVVRDGYLVKTWGDPAKRGDWASASKPVISTLLFFAAEEKRVPSVDGSVRPWVQKRWPGKHLIEKDHTMTFRHLGDMTSGYARAEAPGTHWAYNDYAIKLYASLVSAVFDQTLDEALRERLSPLAFEDGGVFGSRGGFGVDASPRDFARIGLFWMHRGRWKERQLLPQWYFQEYMKPDVPADLPRTNEAGTDYLSIGTHGGGSDQSALGPGVYGFNWWFNERVPGTDKHLAPGLPRDTVQANGHWGSEVMVIIPSLRMVVAARGNWGGMDLRHAQLYHGGRHGPQARRSIRTVT